MINFPLNPSVNDIYSIDNKSWKWNGYAWDIYVTNNIDILWNQSNSQQNIINNIYNTVNNTSNTLNILYNTVNTNSNTVNNSNTLNIVYNTVNNSNTLNIVYNTVNNTSNTLNILYNTVNSNSNTLNTKGNVSSISNISINKSIVRFSGTTANNIQNSSVIISDTGEISGYLGNINYQFDTSYTLQLSDTGKIIDHNNSGAITTTLPNNLPVGFCCTYVQSGTGQITFSAASGASFTSYQTKTKISGKYAGVTIYVRNNSTGTNSEYQIMGNMA